MGGAPVVINNRRVRGTGGKTSRHPVQLHDGVCTVGS